MHGKRIAIGLIKRNALKGVEAKEEKSIWQNTLNESAPRYKNVAMLSYILL